MNYAVVWREEGGPPGVGRLELAAEGIVLEGSTSTVRESRRVLPFEDLVSARVERRGQPGRETCRALVLECRDGTEVEVTPVGATGVLHEMNERLAVARGKAGTAIRARMEAPGRAARGHAHAWR